MMLQFGTILETRTNIKTMMMEIVNGKLHIYFKVTIQKFGSLYKAF